MQHESETLTNVTSARNGAAAALRAAAANPGDAASIDALNTAEKTLSGRMGGLRLQMEAYPELKANTIMTQLSEELSSTENRIAFARQAFNDAVTEYNIQRKTFPTHLLASPFGHPKDASLLAFEDSAAIQAAPKVGF
jgi:LemA protein